MSYICPAPTGTDSSTEDVYLLQLVADTDNINLNHSKWKSNGVPAHAIGRQAGRQELCS